MAPFLVSSESRPRMATEFSPLPYLDTEPTKHSGYQYPAIPRALVRAHTITSDGHMSKSGHCPAAALNQVEAAERHCERTTRPPPYLDTGPTNHSGYQNPAVPSVPMRTRLGHDGHVRKRKPQS